MEHVSELNYIQRSLKYPGEAEKLQFFIFTYSSKNWYGAVSARAESKTDAKTRIALLFFMAFGLKMTEENAPLIYDINYIFIPL